MREKLTYQACMAQLWTMVAAIDELPIDDLAFIARLLASADHTQLTMAVSCDAADIARDIALLRALGAFKESLALIDMPGTAS